MSGVIEFIEQVIGDKSLSPAQKVILKAIYGEELSAEELPIFQEMTKLERYRAREWEEITVVAGRGSGKSNQLAANLAIYEAVGRKHTLSVGETALVMVVSSEQRRQSRVEFRYILKKMEGSAVLKSMIESSTSDEIRLKNGVTVAVFPCHLARVRGPSLQMCVADELAFWKSEGVSVDREVMEAIRPGLRLPHSKLIKISSPFGMRGELYYDFKHYHGIENDDVLVFQAPTLLLNPSFSLKRLAAAKRRDPVSFATEFEANFRTDLSGLLDPAVITSAVNPDRPLELPYRKAAGPYYAFVDVAGGGGKDSFAMAIAHSENEKVIIDVVKSRAPKFDADEVTGQFSTLIKEYGVGEVQGDKFSGDIASNRFIKCGLNYIRAEKTKAELYLEAERVFNTGKIEIPSREVLVAQLGSLVRKTRSGGRDSVDSDGGQPEDEAKAVSGAAVMTVLEKGGGFYIGGGGLGNLHPGDGGGDSDGGYARWEESRGVPPSQWRK